MKFIILKTGGLAPGFFIAKIDYFEGWKYLKMNVNNT